MYLLDLSANECYKKFIFFSITSVVAYQSEGKKETQECEI